MGENWEESVYKHDPKHYHADAVTDIPGINYFFLGNGHIEAVVQVNMYGEGTPVGLLVMHPEIFGPKAAALSFSPENGLQSTMIAVETAQQGFDFIPSTLEYRWTKISGIPAAELSWRNNLVMAVERFFCPDRSRALFLREVTLRNISGNKQVFTVKSGIGKKILSRDCMLGSGKETTLYLEYSLKTADDKPELSVTLGEKPETGMDAVAFWNNVPAGNFHSALLDNLFHSSAFQLQAVISHRGHMDASIWQYNLEWSRDQAMTVLGLLMAGQFELAQVMMRRLLDEFVSDEGDAIDSGRRRDKKIVELDQNGELLYALKFYCNWTGDTEIIPKFWHKIKPLADYLLDEYFVHPESGMLHNFREFWERSDVYGIEDGFELASQVYAVLGLNAAAEFAGQMKDTDAVKRWHAFAGKLLNSILHDEKYNMIDNGHFVKRKGLDGSIQNRLTVPEQTVVPAGVPLADMKPNELNPDAEIVYPVMWGMIDPLSDLADKTFTEVEKLWNQTWDFGGYARYNVSSDPGGQGPWPFASMQIARAYLEAKRYDDVWRTLNWMGTVSGAKTGTHFEFFGPRPVPPCPQVGIVGWNWAENIIFFIHHLLGIRPEGDKLVIRPRLLTNMFGMAVSARIRSFRLHLSVKRSDEKGYAVNGEFVQSDSEIIELKMPEDDTFIEICR